MATIRGVYKKCVEVDINVSQAIEAIAKEFAIYHVLFPDSDNYWVVEIQDNIQKLVEYKDTSYHGSPQPEPTGREITDKYQIKSYEILKDLENLWRKANEKNTNCT